MMSTCAGLGVDLDLHEVGLAAEAEPHSQVAAALEVPARLEDGGRAPHGIGEPLLRGREERLAGGAGQGPLGPAGADEVGDAHPVLGIGLLEDDPVLDVEIFGLEAGEGRRVLRQLGLGPGGDGHLEQPLLEDAGGVPHRPAVDGQVGGGVGGHGEEAGVVLVLEADPLERHAQLVGRDLAVGGLGVHADVGPAAEDGDRAVVALEVHRRSRSSRPSRPTRGSR